METKEEEIPQLKVKEIPPNCPICPPCPVCPPKPKPWQVCLKIFLLLVAGLALAFVILAVSGLRIVKKESLLDIWLASRRGISPTPEAVQPTPTESSDGWPEDVVAAMPTYTNYDLNFSIKVADWEVFKANSEEVELGVILETTPFLIITRHLTDFSSTKICTPNTLQAPCIVSDYWDQNKKGVKETELSGVKARQFWVWRTVGKSEMVVQTLEKPYIELRFWTNFRGYTEKHYDQILSTFKFLDKEIVSQTEKIKTISYGKIHGWLEYSSPTGYSIQYPPSFQLSDVNEEIREGGCYQYFNNNAGGLLMTKVVPYDGGSRRQLYGILPSYTYAFEEVMIQGYKSLIIERGPLGDSGSGSGVVIPVGDKALILSWSNRGKDSEEFQNLLKSVVIKAPLSIEKCKTQ